MLQLMPRNFDSERRGYVGVLRLLSHNSRTSITLFNFLSAKLRVLASVLVTLGLSGTSRGCKRLYLGLECSVSRVILSIGTHSRFLHAHAVPLRLDAEQRSFDQTPLRAKNRRRAPHRPLRCKKQSRAPQ